MKRVKCYGRMKTACIDERAKKVFDDSFESLWDLSHTGETEKKQSCVQLKRVDVGSAGLFSVGGSSDNKSTGDEENSENIPPKKAKRGKAPPKKKREPKARKAKASKPDEKVPNFSLIEEHALCVEKTGRKVGRLFCTRSKQVGSRRRVMERKRNEAEPEEPITEEGILSEKNGQVSVIERDLISSEPIRNEVILSERNGQLSVKEPDWISTEPITEEVILSERNGQLSVKEPDWISSEPITEEVILSERNGQLSVKEPNWISSEPITEEVILSEGQLRLSVKEPDLMSIHEEPGCMAAIASQREERPRLSLEEPNSISSSEPFPDKPISPESQVKLSIEEYNSMFQSQFNPQKRGLAWYSTPIVKDRKLGGSVFPSPDVSRISSCASLQKRLKFVTSTPSTQKSVATAPPLFNLSQIQVPPENDFSKRVNSILAMTRVRNVLSDVSRSLTVLYDASKLVNEHPSAAVRSATDSKRSRFCGERSGSSKKTLSGHQSACVEQKLLQLCGQESIAPIASVYDWGLVKIKKIGEGTYGEVFMLSQKKPSVIKIIPVSQDATDSWLNLESVYSEVKVSHCLSALRKNKDNKTSNFSKLNRVHFVKGCYPEKLVAAWDRFSVAKTTYNVRPDCFNQDQLYVILDLEYGGKDMTCFEMKNAMEAESILKQIVLSLAIAEETHLFEHRDLHLGNILVQKVKKKSIPYVLGGKPLSIPSEGVMVSIIDFTLSRVFDAGCVYFHDLADDESLFDQSGDVQFEIYRATREYLQNQWQECALYSNVLWLTFLCVKMREYKYSNPNSKKHLKSLSEIAAFHRGVQGCKSALQSLKLIKIPVTALPSSSSIESMQLKKTKFVDRKSLQKSKTNLRN